MGVSVKRRMRGRGGGGAPAGGLLRRSPQLDEDDERLWVYAPVHPATRKLPGRLFVDGQLIVGVAECAAAPTAPQKSSSSLLSSGSRAMASSASWKATGEAS